MSTSGKKSSDAKHRSYLGPLLISLVFLLMVVPAIERSSLATGLFRLGITAVLISAAVATRRRKALLIFGLLVVVVAAPASWMTMFFDQPTFFLFNSLLQGAFFVLMAVLILITVMQRHLATVHSIFGAISAYLLLGLAWAVLYLGIAHVDSNAFGAAHEVTEVGAFSQFVYFSFVTMSTLGYGDITPQSSAAQTLAWMQSVTGQFYIAVLVAWLVSEIPKPPAESVVE